MRSKNRAMREKNQPKIIVMWREMEFMKKVETQVFYALSVCERSANIKHEKLLRLVEKMEQKNGQNVVNLCATSH